MEMTPFERIDAATRLERPDRVPVVPMMDIFAARHAGITQHEMLFNIHLADWSIQKTMDDLGRLDGFSFSYAGMGTLLELAIPNPPRLPGRRGVPHDSEWMFVERPVMEPSEYADIARKGMIRHTMGKVLQTHPWLRDPATLVSQSTRALADQARVALSARRWRRKGVEPMAAGNLVFTPMEWFSIVLRGFNGFLLDMFRHPDEIRKASEAMKRTLRAVGMAGVKLSGVRRVFMAGARTSSAVISKKQFEELALPEWQEMAEYFVRNGVTPILHFDSDWTDFFPLLRHLPKRKCILNLDGASDIFKAREVLGDHMCIMGDVPATMLKLGEPGEVDAYCERLIKEIGGDGGFILSSGCTVPSDARPENVKAMILSVRKHR